MRRTTGWGSGALVSAVPAPLVAASWLGWTLVLAYSFAPFDFATDLDGFSIFTRGWSGASWERIVTEITLHSIVFGLVGATDRFAHHAPDALDRANRPVLAKGLVLCLLIEVGQLYMDSRHATVEDLVLNSVALSVGHLLASRSHARSTRDNHWPGVRRILTSRGFRWGSLAAWSTCWAVIVLLPPHFVQLDSWDLSFPVMIGNERSGDRPWRGELRYVAIYDRALAATDVSQLLQHEPGSPDSTSTRLGLGLLTAYDLAGGNATVLAPQGRLDDARLAMRTSPGLALTPQGAVLDGDHWLASVGAGEPLTVSIARTGEFTVEVWGRAADLAQSGPARIIGISSGTLERNFTLGQEGRAVHFRVRNALNGPNGIANVLRAPDVLSSEPFHIAATYDRGVSELFHNGRRQNARVNLRQPSAVLGLGSGLPGVLATACLAALSLLVVAPYPRRRTPSGSL
jgi:hypothetical protein